MPEIEIRHVSLSHAPLLTTLHAASFSMAAWSLAQMQGSLALGTTQGWVAFENGKALGFILCQTLPGEAEILTFAVHPEAQRRGIGENLLQKAIENNRNSRLFLEVAADNKAAERLYEKHGFRKSGIRKDYYQRGGVSIDAVLYERILSEQ